MFLQGKVGSGRLKKKKSTSIGGVIRREKGFFYMMGHRGREMMAGKGHVYPFQHGEKLPEGE